MAEPLDNMQRIAMGTFTDAHLLNSTVQELVAHSVMPEQMCVVGYEPALHRLAQALKAGKLEPVGAWLSRVRRVGSVDGGDLVVSAATSLVNVDFDTERCAQGLLSGVEPLMSDGVVALFVEARTVAEFAAVTRLLLRYSSHRVRTREVSQANK